MDSHTEELFAKFASSDRLVMVEALQLAVTDGDSRELRLSAAELCARLGYPESAAAAQRIRAACVRAGGGESIVDRIAEYSVRV